MVDLAIVSQLYNCLSTYIALFWNVKMRTLNLFISLIRALTFCTAWNKSYSQTLKAPFSEYLDFANNWPCRLIC